MNNDQGEDWKIDGDANLETLLHRPTALYSLAPEGTEGKGVESLSGYVTRLAAAHRVPVGILLAHSLAPHILDKSYLNASPHILYNRLVSSGSGCINGLGSVASRWVDVLGALTGLGSRLKFLTMLPFAKVLSNRNLNRPHQAWCSVCYQQDLEKGRPMYHRLLWTLSAVSVCLEHSVVLDECCPACQYKIPSLTYAAHVGYCPRCKAFLGNMQTKIVAECPEQQWSAQQVQAMLFNVLSHEAVLSRDGLSNSIKQIINNVQIGIPSCALHCSLSSNTIRRWIKCSDEFPLLGGLLDFSQGMHVPLSRVIGLDDMNSVRKTDTHEILPIKVKSKQVKILDRAALEHHLESALLANDPRSFTCTCQELELSPATVRPMFPALARAISQRYKQHCSQLRQRRLNALHNEVEEVVSRLDQEGLIPTLTRVSQRMNNSNSMLTASYQRFLLSEKRNICR